MKKPPFLERNRKQIIWFWFCLPLHREVNELTTPRRWLRWGRPCLGSGTRVPKVPSPGPAHGTSPAGPGCRARGARLQPGRCRCLRGWGRGRGRRWGWGRGCFPSPARAGRRAFRIALGWGGPGQSQGSACHEELKTLQKLSDELPALGSLGGSRQPRPGWGLRVPQLATVVERRRYSACVKFPSSGKKLRR